MVICLDKNVYFHIKHINNKKYVKLPKFVMYSQKKKKVYNVKVF